MMVANVVSIRERESKGEGKKGEGKNGGVIGEETCTNEF